MSEDHGQVSRREFLKRAAAGATAATIFPSVVSADSSIDEPEQRPIKTINDIPGLSAEMHDWKPVDITDRLKEGTKEINKPIFEPPGWYDTVSPSGNWWMSHTVIALLPISKLLGRPYSRVSFSDLSTRDRALFDTINQRIYHLHIGDDKLAGFPSEDFECSTFSGDRSVNDNGVSMSLLTWPYPSRAKDTVFVENVLCAEIISDIRNSRKIIIRPTEDYQGGVFGHITREKGSYGFTLSKDGNRLVIVDYVRGALGGDRFYIANLDNLGVMYQSEDHFAAINDDATVVAYSGNVGDGRLRLMRRDLKTDDRTVMEHLIWHPSNVKFSPDGSFCAVSTGRYWESSGYFQVYVHPTGEYFSIHHPIPKDYVISLADDGTIKSASGTYKYQNGMYHRATEGKLRPEGLKITKR